jgi:predicted site-specific integrase-resolvase
MNLKEVSDFLGLSYTRIYELVSSGKIKKLAHGYYCKTSVIKLYDDMQERKKIMESKK